jgi:predicted enzyme related to lactoylglutathione lyase
MELRICIDVDDLERAIAFYTQGLQLQLGRRLSSDWCELLGGPCPIDLLCEPADSAPVLAENPQRRHYERHWTPVHLDVIVDDVDSAIARLVDSGAVLERPVQQRRWGRMANLSDPWGHGFDLLEFQGRGYDEILGSAGE